MSTAEAEGQVAYDVVIRGGRICDGTGAPWYEADIAIRGGVIVQIGRLTDVTATREIDATGLVVAPGFIDMMGQTATPMLDDPGTAINLLTQGITTINAGEGVSAAPLQPSERERRGWSTMAEYFQLLDTAGLPVNVVQTIGHTQVRRLVLGEVDRRPTDEELDQMRALVREAMESGAIGVSTALIYPPAVYATTEEIAALVEVAGEYGGRYYTHMRNEGDRLLEAIDEALEIGTMGKAPVHIFHLKAAGRQNWGKMPLAIARIQAARAVGQDVTADIYPYINNGLGIAAFIHPRHFGEGREKLLRRLDDAELRKTIRHEMETTDGWENWYRHVGFDWGKVVIGQAGDPRYTGLTGRSVAEIAKELNEDPWETFFNLVRGGAFALPESMTEVNKILALQQEFVSFCTDVGPAGGSRIASHPRAFGSFPRMLSRYVRDLGAVSLEQAISQASAVAANAVSAYDRGRIAVGQAADIILFDRDEVSDRATFSEPHALSHGMQYVLVNGSVVLEAGEYTGARPGRVLRGPGYRESTAPHAVSTGSIHPRTSPLDEVIEEFMREHRIPGLSVAVTKDGRLVYARGFGYADVAEKTPVEPASLFRIASISKPVTAVAILKLVESGKLSLDDKVFEILDYEPHLPDGVDFDERQREITIRHLLQHRGGWDRNASFDAMFRSVAFAKELGLEPPAEPDAIIRVMLGKPLDFAPGERYAYSNYGYCLLGRVIEKLTGQAYVDFVRSAILEPVGIESMTIGGTRLSDRLAKEVCYYDPAQGESVFAADLGTTVCHPYGAWCLEAMDSHGGWIASAVDLARFACALDETSANRLLGDEMLAECYTRPEGLAGFDDEGNPLPRYYGLGWSIATDENGIRSATHDGSLPGTNTRLWRRGDGLNVAVLFNTRVSPYGSRVVPPLMDRLTPAIEGIEQWPEWDLFEPMADGGE